MHRLKFQLLTWLLTFGMIVGMAQAGSINLVQNGEFETTGVHPKSWSPLLDVPAWYSTEGKIEIWAESFQWRNDLGSDGLTTGQHAEITWRSDKASIATMFVIPETFIAGSLALFSFDYQNRKSSGVLGSVKVNGADFASFTGSSSGSWGFMSLDVSGLSAGDNIELLFGSLGGRSSGAHIDQVAFLVDTNEVSAPATLALLALGIAGLSYSRRKKA
jgi:hypothetical protein